MLISIAGHFIGTRKWHKKTWGILLKHTTCRIVRRGISYRASLFFILLGIGLAFGASTLFASVTFTSSVGRFIRVGTGILLIILGLIQLEKLPNRLMFVLPIFGLAFAIASMQENVVQIAKLHTRTVKRWSGFILVMIGGWIMLLAIFANFFATVFPV